MENLTFDDKEGLPIIFVVKQGIPDDELQRLEKLKLENYQIRYVDDPK